MTHTTVTAAALAIGDELLSGRTKDKNIGHLAQTLTSIGITLMEVRIVQDEESAIVEAINALRSQYDYVFTSGGIGPTHDDITAPSISAALGLECVFDEKAMDLLEKHYVKRDLDFTPARKRMARMPKGSSHIDNPVSKAPGFQIENVFVMAGVPKIFEAMLNNVIPNLKTGSKLISQSVDSSYGEGIIGTPLLEIQTENPEVSIGSYPSFEDDGNFSTEIIIRGVDADKVKDVAGKVQTMLDSLN